MMQLAEGRPYVIYTRKSREDDYQKEMTSLEAQAIQCREYARRPQLLLSDEVYEDEALSGGNMDRPAFQRLLKDIQKGEIGGVLTYKLDRLTRSLYDFVSVIDNHFKKHDVKFISVTEQFDTSTPQGVLFLNLMLMFAQFEREQTSARIKDKVRTSKEKGLWMGGSVPLGYKSQDRKLIVDPETAPMVRKIFELYNETGSIRSILRLWQLQAPEIADHYSYERLRHIITNPIYKLYVPYKGQSFQGRHEAIISEDVWEEAQEMFQNRSRRHVLKGSEFLLMGKCFCHECQVAMCPTHTTKKNGVKYYYLNCHARAQKLRCQGLNKPVSAAVVERKTFDVLRSMLNNPHQIPGFTDYLQKAAESPQEVLRMLKSLDTLS